ncbi:DNA topoisomerase 3-alpha [Bienertia sinuspersici]
MVSNRKQGSHASGSSTISAKSFRGNRRCKCGNKVVVRTVRNGPNVGSKFFGCPLWPDTTCDMFELIEEVNEFDEVQWQLIEKETSITEMEMLNKLKEDKIKKLQFKKKKLEGELEKMKIDLSQIQIELLKCSLDKKILKLVLFISWSLM